MSIVVTGATGHLGRLAVEALLTRGVPAGQIVATGRRVEALADLADAGRRRPAGRLRRRGVAARGVRRRREAAAGLGQRGRAAGPQHGNAIEAAKAAGVGSSPTPASPRPTPPRLLLAAEHRATEQLLAASGIPHALLRNGWYLENYTGQLPVYLQHGIAGAAGDGLVSAATRADYAEAAAAVLAGDGHDGAVYELGGAAFTMAELAGASPPPRQEVAYTDLPVEQYAAVLVGAGLPEPVAAVFADGDRGVADGELHVPGNDLERLIGRAPTSVSDAVAGAVARLRN